MMTPIKIVDLLNRRSDLSTFVVHLTRDYEGTAAKENLRSILSDLSIRARSSMGWMRGLSAKSKENMRVVCFSETPLEHVYTLFAEIPGRRVNLSSYGIAFTKMAARLNDANPIWYVDMTPGRSGGWVIAKALDRLRDDAELAPGGFDSHPASRILPFVEQMGSWPGSKKEFWWEREWRHLGDFTFRKSDVAVVLCPETDIPEFSSLGYRAVDPSWSLERTIASLAGAVVHSRDATVKPQSRSCEPRGDH